MDVARKVAQKVTHLLLSHTAVYSAKVNRTVIKLQEFNGTEVFGTEKENHVLMVSKFAQIATAMLHCF